MDKKSLIRILTRETLDKNGVPSPARAEAVCDYIDGLDVSSGEKIAMLRAYKKAIEPIADKSKIEIAASGKLGEKAKMTIGEIVFKQTGRRLEKIEEKIDSKLLGGIRITVGDTILENSLRNELQSLKSTKI